MVHAKSRQDKDGKLISLEQMTVEQLQAVADEYGLSKEGTKPELVAAVKDYEFKTGKTVQPAHFTDSQHRTPEKTYGAPVPPAPTPAHKAVVTEKTETGRPAEPEIMSGSKFKTRNKE